jgi:hypothetical protein
MNRDAATAIAGFAGFQLLTLWNNNAPSLQDVRAKPAGDTATAAKLRDADMLVGGTVVILGGAIYLFSGDATTLLVMATVFVGVSLWNHAVLNASPVGSDAIGETYGD